jgi:lipopolysaccharide transport system ATP-binding protein
MTPAISVNRLSKRYTLGSGAPGYRTLREMLSETPRALYRGLRSLPRLRRRSARGRVERSNDLWALKDVCLEVPEGEVVGFVGHNGAGKSTLLRILTRVTEPTAGRAVVRGRVGSLLEVGTGFHPELTGRENIYLNGAILGMTRQEINRKFDSIVAFAEVDRFLDTPVKRYSSGMTVRLAFAVASHLEPEILIIDEVLAVGDATFQQKCLRKMKEVSGGGRTVLFVSHNMSAVKSLCTRAILLKAGRVVKDDDVDRVVNAYLSTGGGRATDGAIPANAARMTNGEARFRAVRVTDLDGNPAAELYHTQPFRITFACDVLKEIPDGHFEVSIYTQDGTPVVYCTNARPGGQGARLKAGLYQGEVVIDTVLLPRGYTVVPGVHHREGTTADFVYRTWDFHVLPVAKEGNDHYPWKNVRGLVRATGRWQLSAGRPGVPPAPDLSVAAAADGGMPSAE